MSEAFPHPHTLLKKYDLRAKKSWGQNFLTSERVYRAIVDSCVKQNDDWIVEIGCGLGTLTMRLAERIPEGKLIAVEKEPDMLHVLKHELAHLDNIDIHPANALTYDFKSIHRWRGESFVVCGNLPYQIASQIMFRVLEHRAMIHRGVFMIQREMADRILAPPGNKTYGALTVMIGAYADISRVVHARPGDFTPAPRVESTVIALDMPRREPFDIPDEVLFSKVVHLAFSQRRKTLRNNLKQAWSAEDIDSVFRETEIDGGRRGETLSIAEFTALTTALSSHTPLHSSQTT